MCDQPDRGSALKEVKLALRLPTVRHFRYDSDHSTSFTEAESKYGMVFDGYNGPRAYFMVCFGENHWALHTHTPRPLLSRPDRKQELCGLHFGHSNKAEQKLLCNAGTLFKYMQIQTRLSCLTVWSVAYLP